MPGDPNKPLQAPDDAGHAGPPQAQHLDANGAWIYGDSGQTGSNGNGQNVPSSDNRGSTGVPNNLPQPGQNGIAGGVNYDAPNNLASFSPGATTGQIQDPTAWGGTSGAVVIGPDGKPMVDTSMSGRGQDVTRLRGTADAAAKRQAYQMDYGQGNIDRATAGATRDRQVAATDLLSGAARGNAPSGAVIRGQNASDDSFASQLATQSGGRGGAVAQGAAGAVGLQTGQQGQLGVASHLGGARSNELTQARTAYSQGTAAQRKGDYQQQALDQARAKAKYENDLSQRELNDKRQLGYEQLGFGVNDASMNAGLAEGDRRAGIFQTSLQRDTQQADRMAQFYGQSLNSAAKLGTGIASGGGGDDPNKDG